ncbi:Uncharacterised protein [Vibrio cholerae]|nr:Uncharacterised protein [Vibrio cholerae]
MQCGFVVIIQPTSTHNVLATLIKTCQRHAEALCGMRFPVFGF